MLISTVSITFLKMPIHNLTQDKIMRRERKLSDYRLAIILIVTGTVCLVLYANGF